MTDVLFDNATVWVESPPRPQRGWLRLHDGRIADHGTGAPPASATVRDLAGQHVLPGFVDSHSHLSVAAWLPRTLDAARWRTANDILDAVARAAATRSETAWILATDADLDPIEGALPKPDDLDRAAGGRPVLVADFSLHRSLASSAALAAILTGNDYGGDIDRRSGSPTGMLWESAHAAAFRLALEDAARIIDAQERAALLDQEAHRHLACGIVACHDPCVPLSLVEELEALRKRTPLKLSWSMVAGSGMLYPASVSELCGCCGEGPSSAKLFVDGAHRCALCLDPSHVLQMMGRAALGAMRGDLKPIAGMQSSKSVWRDGKIHIPYLRCEQPALTKRLTLLAERGARPRIHAVGNAVAAVAAEALIESDAAGATLEHLTFLTEREIERVARSRAMVSMQPGFLHRFGPDILSRRMTPRLRAYPLASLLKAGVGVALSSDSPCGPLPPLANIRTAVNRTLADGRSVDVREAIPLVNAVEGYTTLGHRAIHGHHGGGITRSAAADLAVLSGDPMSPATEVVETWIGGQRVWAKS